MGVPMGGSVVKKKFFCANGRKDDDGQKGGQQKRFLVHEMGGVRTMEGRETKKKHSWVL